MKRNKALKTIAIAAISIVSITGILSCENKTEEILTVKIEQPQEKTAREKLIINRVENKFADSANPTDFELKHTPEITFGEKDKNGFTEILITIGSEGIIHPTKEDHWIDFLTVFVNDIEIQNIEFANGYIRGYNNCFAKLKSGDKIKVIAGCNIHGIWQNEVNFE